MLALFLLVPVPAIIFRLYNTSRPNKIELNSAGARPNILIITSDGISATHLSLYGYERQTTPNLEKLATSSLVAENAFANAGSTTGSVVSMYTGKLPFRTKVLYPPDILRGADAYQHLPGILKSLGYYNAQFTVPHYADAAKLNLLEGFDLINGREATEIGSVSTLNQFMPINEANFFNELYQRLVSRLGFIFHVADMENPYKQVTRPAKRIEDLLKIHKAIKLLQTSNQPVFIHIHLMGTHGPQWYPAEQLFSAGQDVNHQKLWNGDFYDDSIREFDQSIGSVIKELKRKNLLEKTIIIIGSDHGEKWDNLQRIPMLIHFPDNAFSGNITVNVQNLDLAPTILDYMGLKKPEWMDGESLLEIGDSQRPILTTMISGSNFESIGNDLLQTDQHQAGPPFYQFDTLSIINCQRWDRLWLHDRMLEVGEIGGHTAPCKEGDLLTREQALELIVDYLKGNNFDVSSIEDSKTISNKP